MPPTSPILVTGAAGKVGAIGPTVTDLLLRDGFKVRALVRREDERADALRTLGAEVVVGDMTKLDDMHRAIAGCRRVYFAMSVAAGYLEATTNAAAVARHHGVDAFVNMSQMTVSQMSITETSPSPQHKQHWLAEQVLNWSGLPVVHVRATAFMDVFFHRFAVRGICEHGELRLPFANGKTSPIAAFDVARVVAAVLSDPATHLGHVYELTGPQCEDMHGIAAQYSRALERDIRYVNVPREPWEAELFATASSPHLAQHLSAMALLHRENRYDRLTADVERLTGTPPMSVEDFVRRNAKAYLPS
ncbi:NmrA family NAD(P)-binding protein [Variovorax sp. J22R133]|uniref:NmrA family NAD(P)-binding protein n=1 Tax=Variovorax brevis TaxID=3053503 RepID=UPI002577D3AB|nr:NmrA family NAD(P)-binding protein [Variovorax sp. J22R133]MDM0111398.1 NmrA family NAD(P)-binding protein [Variovorax sp. J22R133]